MKMFPDLEKRYCKERMSVIDTQRLAMEASLMIGTVLYKNEKFTISKAGRFLQNEPLVSVNIDLNHEMN